MKSDNMTNVGVMSGMLLWMTPATWVVLLGMTSWMPSGTASGTASAMTWAIMSVSDVGDDNVFSSKF